MTFPNTYKKHPVMETLPEDVPEEQSVLQTEFGASLFPVYQLVNSIVHSMKPTTGDVYGYFALSFKNKTMDYLGTKSGWLKISKTLQQKLLDDADLLDRLESKLETLREELRLLSRELTELEQKESSELLSIYKKYININQKLYDYGLPLVFIDYEHSAGLKESLLSRLKKKMSGSSRSESILRELVSPDKKTSLLLAEEELQKLIKRSDGNPTNKQISMFLDKWSWVTYGYEGPPMDSSYIEEKKVVNKKENSDKPQKTPNFITEDKKIKKISKILKKAMYLKPERKLIQSFGYFITEPLFRELAQRLKISLIEFRFLTPLEVEQSIEKRSTPNNLMDRLNQCLFIMNENGEYVVTKENLINDYLKKYLKTSVLDESELTGTVAYNGGVVAGRAVIINSLSDVDKFREGNIIVSHATNPNLTPFMLKAEGIITNMGGITSHAAIIAREFRIPTIIGVREATEKLKDGDQIIMNTNTGDITIKQN